MSLHASHNPFWFFRTARLLALSLVLVIFTLCADSSAQTASLDGSWSGAGTVSFTSGERETARCRAQYRRASTTSYLVTAICATPSGRATQTATLKHAGGNNYQGSFHNSEYNVSGTISVAVTGERQLVQLNSDAGTASFELRR
jgi:hypothetical protein